MRSSKLYFLIIVILAAFLFLADHAFALNLDLIQKVRLDIETVNKGYTIKSTDENFLLGITSGVLDDESEIVLKTFYHKNYLEDHVINDDELDFVVDYPTNEGKILLGRIYEFDVKNKEAYDSAEPIWLKIKFVDNTNLKNIYYWDKGKQLWINLPSTVDYELGEVKAAIHLPYARIALLADNENFYAGEASWYKYKGCDCAASRDYAKGSKVKVTNLENDKSVIVEINDYGPQEWTGRIIDLDKVAFEKLGNLWQGLLEVKVEVISLK